MQKRFLFRLHDTGAKHGAGAAIRGQNTELLPVTLDNFSRYSRSSVAFSSSAGQSRIPIIERRKHSTSSIVMRLGGATALTRFRRISSVVERGASKGISLDQYGASWT